MTAPKSQSLRLVILLLRRNAMIGWVLVCALGAWLAPGIGARGGPLHPEVTLQIAVASIFFLQGLLLPLEALRAGLKAWKLHLVAQCSIFLLAPGCAFLFCWLAGGWLTPEVRLGILFLGILPTTVAAAAALTAQAGGNVAGALFNTCLSNIAGIVIVPAIATLLAPDGMGDVAFFPLVKSITLQLLLPLVLGQGLRPLLGKWALRHGIGIRRVNSALILFMLYTALCNAVQDRVWQQGGMSMVLSSAVGAAFFLAAMIGLTLALGRLVGLRREDRVAATFCGSQKTLAAGVPLAQTIFGSAGGAVGIIILPLIFYHTFQLTSGVILAMGWARAKEREAHRPG